MQKERKKQTLFWIVLFGVMCMGEVLGALHARMLSGETLLETERIFQNALKTADVTGKKVFLSALCEKGKWGILFYVLGLFRWTTPLNFLAMGTKGYLIGFAATFLLREGSRGLFLYFILFAILLEIPCFFAMIRLGKLYGERRYREASTQKKNELFRTYTLAMSLLFLLLVGESALESCLFSWVLYT